MSGLHPLKKHSLLRIYSNQGKREGGYMDELEQCRSIFRIPILVILNKN